MPEKVAQKEAAGYHTSLGDTMRKIYWRCNSGHYYSSLHCPYDGWTFDGCAELAAAAKGVVEKGNTLSISELTRKGVPQRALERAIIIEFGSDRAIFDAISPESYIIGGEHKSTNELSLDHR